MTLQVIGAGFGRTGTMSTYTALNQLGFPCYHMIEVMQNKANKSHLDFWSKVAHSKPATAHDWEQVFSNYTAAVDNPACCVWRELMIAYPEAKVLLTLHPRGPAAWYESTIETIYFTENRWQVKLLAKLLPSLGKLSDMCHRLIWKRNHQGTMVDHDGAVAHYQKHVEDVKAAVPADRLLVFSVDQGWEPLCKFLGVPVPETPFPRVNDRVEVQRLIRGMIVAGYVTVALAAAVVAVVVYAVIALVT